MSLGWLLDSTRDLGWADDPPSDLVSCLDQHLHQHHLELTQCGGPDLHLCLGHHMHPFCLWCSCGIYRNLDKEESSSEGTGLQNIYKL